MLTTLLKIPAFLIGEAREKLDVRGTWNELKALGQKYGRRFFIAAVIWELVEDGVFPAIAAWHEVYWLIPFFLVMHFEPVVYPIFFFAFRTWDRIQGKEPWEPDRLAQSTYTRAGLQMLSYRVPAFVMFYLLLADMGVTFWVLTVYALGMSLFSLVHNRIWHDFNYGIDVPTDTVQPKRIVAMAFTYRAVSILVMTSVFLGLTNAIPGAMWAYQGSMLILHIVLGGLWARSALGITPVVQKG